MSVETYGEHAESAARALNRLLQEDAIPVDPAAVDQLLRCREAVIDALRQRLYAFGLDAPVRVEQLPAPPSGVNLEGIDFKLATLLDNIAFSTPSLPLEERLAPTDVLGRASTDPVTETWRNAAIDMLAASHALGLACDKPWLHDPGAGWHLMRDAAVAIEAVLVLDARLAEVGLLSQHDISDYPMGLEEKRLVASQAARVATWYATTDAPDHAAPRLPWPSRSNVFHPVSLVSAPEDLAAGQQRLANFLRPLDVHDSAYAGEREISADSARQVTASQLCLCRVFGQMSRRLPQTQAFVGVFEARAEVLAALQPQLRFLVDVEPAEPNMRRFWQQGELTTATTRMEDQDVDLRLHPLQMLALANATHDVTHNLGMCLRRELLRGNSNLRDANPRHEEGPVRVSRRSRLEATVTDLVHMPAPNIPVATYSTPLQRAALRRTLDVTPTAGRPPAPYPAARGLAASDHGR
jgi:hypothetical protein